MAKSTRVQISEETIQELERLAEVYSCLYDGKPSISKLMAKIGAKQLNIQAGQTNERDFDMPLLLLTMASPFNLNGIVATITERIARVKGNIFKADARPETANLGTLKIYLSFPKHNTQVLSDLLTDIQSIQFQDIAEYNEPYQLIGAHTLLVNLKKTQDIDGTTEDIINHLLKQKVVIETNCIFGMRIVAKNKTGTLAYITQEIAKQKVLISSIEQNFNYAKKEDIFSLFLEIKIQKVRKDQVSDIEKIQNIIEFFERQKGKEGIIDVQRLGIDYLNTP